MSGDDYEKALPAFKKSGVDKVIEKPITLEKLKEVLEF